MKLTNPTDDQLDAAFAEKVAGWKMLRQELFGTHYIPRWCPPNMPDAVNMLALDTKPPPFTRSMDAVLPWLEKMPSFEIVALAYSVVGERYECRVWPTLSQSSGANNVFLGRADIPSTAAVIALLRANGVEVEFSE